MTDIYEMYSKGANNEEEAVSLTMNIVKPDISKEESQRMYQHWAPNYNKDLQLANYNGSPMIVAEISRLLGDKKHATFLDCACGTGLIGIELKLMGFTNVDGLDSSEAMLEEAKKTGAYKKLILAEIGPQPLDIPDGTYDAVVMSGAMFFGHVSPDCLVEFTRITKPGGLIVISKGGSAKIDAKIPEIVELESLGQQLEREGKCRLLEKVTKQNFIKGHHGYIYIYSPIG